MLDDVKAAVLTLVSSILLLAGQGNDSFAGEPPGKAAKPRLYDTSADGKVQIAAALKTAKTEHKRVLLKFGANW